MLIKTSELTGAALDWAVASLEFPDDVIGNLQRCTGHCGEEYAHRFSTNWSQGGPIIDREKIELVPSTGGTFWYAESLVGGHRAELCKTPLIAAMRCYVTSKLGDEVDIPEELC